MTDLPEGNAIVYCEGNFCTPNGKTAHGLVRFTNRYRVAAVIDSRYAGQDAREALDGRPSGIPVVSTLKEAIAASEGRDLKATHFVIGLAPDGGRLPEDARMVVAEALTAGLNVDSGMHDFLSEDPHLADLAAASGVHIRDVRKPPTRNKLHFFSGKIEEVDSLKIAVLGTDSAVGKRTTAWLIVQGFQKAGHTAGMIGTGQTAWMQGTPYSIVLDSLVNDFVSGEIEHAVWRCWSETRPAVIVLEGQGSLMNPAFPGGFELLAAGRPDIVVLQHAPARLEYDGFPGYPLHPLPHQIQAVEVLSGRPVVAITVNHENMRPDEVAAACERITRQTGLPAYDVLLDGPESLIEQLKKELAQKQTEKASR